MTKQPVNTFYSNSAAITEKSFDEDETGAETSISIRKDSVNRLIRSSEGQIVYEDTASPKHYMMETDRSFNEYTQPKKTPNGPAKNSPARADENGTIPIVKAGSPKRIAA